MTTQQRSDALPTGYELDRYRIVRVLGDGGFGITYLGEHAAGWQVAIKELFPSEYAFREGGNTRSGNANVIARGGSYAENFQEMKTSFLREARILAQFAEHPNIVTVKDFFEANGTAYLVMQYEDGQTLEAWLEKNPHPSQEQLLQIFIPVLDGLRAVHAANYLHRDIKPGNIYIRTDGRPFLLDFGATREVIANKKTMVLTDGYAPFEQYSTNGNQGAWSDIYATGATLWTCISGGKTPASAMNRANARMDGSPDPYQLAKVIANGCYPGEFLAAIDWALMFVIKDRPQTVREWQDRLLELLQQKPKQHQPVQAAPVPQQPAVVLPKSTSQPAPQCYPSGQQFHQNKSILEPEMVHVPSGKFTMGCVEGLKNWLGRLVGNRDDVEGGCFADEKPAHEVSLSAFAIGKYPVTFAEFDCFCAATDFPKPKDNGWGRGNRPVINVSWTDAQAYCHWLNEMTGKAYRLPTEAEWEYAARAGSTTAYPWGMQADPKFANYGRKVGKTTPVGQYPANGYGLHDMHGNVWEWCQDWYASDYYASSPASNPKGATSGAYRVLRGGSWRSNARHVRSADRGDGTPGLRYNFIGFRLVLP